MDSSKFHLWRACFSFCHIDSVLSPQEKTWLKNKITTLNFTSEQKTILEQDLKTPPEILKLLALITKPSDKSFLIDQMRVLGHMDGLLSDVEKIKINQIRDIVMSRIDLASLEKQIAQVPTQKVSDKASFMDSVSTFVSKED